MRMRSLAWMPACALLAGCAVALGPGFSQATRAVGVSATSIEPTRVHVQVTDTLENVGNRPLSYLEVVLPNGPSFGTRDVSITVTGKPVAARAAEAGETLRIPFDPPWAQGEIKKIAFGYDFDPDAEGRGVVAATPDGFYLASPNAFPAWQKPLGPFAQGSLTAQSEELEISVPADFRVLALGREQRSERRGELVVHRFKRLGLGFPPYVVAGRYQERRVQTQQGSVVFWTKRPVDPGAAQMAADHLMATVSAYDRMFGPVAGTVADHGPAIYLVETSAELAPIAEMTTALAAASFPDGILFDQRAVALGLASEPVLQLGDYELARTWFGWHVRPQPDAELLLGRGMALCASVLAAEARGGPDVRRQEIERLIGIYDRLGPAAEEKPGFGLAAESTRDEARAKMYKAAFFLLSLEDIAGTEKFDRAIHRILRDMAGQEIGSEELRSALETETGQNLAPVFHAWLDHPGIPADFRARYPDEP